MDSQGNGERAFSTHCTFSVVTPCFAISSGVGFVPRDDDELKYTTKSCSRKGRSAGRAADPPAGDAWAWEAKWEACLFLHRDADAAAARQTADGLAEKMWWYNHKLFRRAREGSRGPGRRSAGDTPYN